MCGASGCGISVSRGNPNLKPFTDTTLDFSVEYYFGKVGLLSAGVFQKYIKNYIVSQDFGVHGVGGQPIPFSQTGVPPSVISGATASTLVDDLNVTFNDPATHSLTGVELAAQSQFFFLPGPLKNLGAVFNFTYVHADQTLTGISPISYNATLYYETNRWGVRASLNHRDRYYTGYDSSSVMSAPFFAFPKAAMELTCTSRALLSKHKFTTFDVPSIFIFSSFALSFGLNEIKAAQ